MQKGFLRSRENDQLFDAVNLYQFQDCTMTIKKYDNSFLITGKRSYFYLVLLFVATLFLSGCVSTQISSYNTLERGHKYSNVFFRFQYIERTKGFAESFCSSFLSTLQEKGVTSEHYIASRSDSTAEGEINTRMAKAGLEVLILMSQIGYRGYKVYGPTGGTFLIKIFKPNSSKHIWRANLEVKGDLGIKTTVDKAVKTLVARLEMDGLL